MSDTSKSQRMAELMDSLLLDILENGREVVCKDGTVTRVQASPSDIREARARVKELATGETLVPGAANAGNKLLEAARLKFQGLDVPSVDEDDVKLETGT